MRWIGVMIIALAMGCEQKPTKDPPAEAQPPTLTAESDADLGGSVRMPRATTDFRADLDCQMISRDPAMAADRVRIDNGKVVVKDGVYFEGTTSTIPVNSYGLLNEIAYQICANPSVGLLQIEVHTNSQGSDAYNLKMSQQKADAILEYLSDFIAPSRLVAKGYGEVQPIAANSTVEGRALNSRVEFKIVE